jgi:SAM-dependent methyltransferase
MSKIKKFIRHSLSDRQILAIKSARHQIICVANRYLPTLGVNLGSGQWSQLCWEAADHRIFGSSRINENTKLPFKSSSLKYVYSSMLFEHLNDKTVENMMAEIYRVLRPGGVFRLIVPDFDLCLERYKDGDLNFFAKEWSTKDRFENWLHHGVLPSLENNLLWAFSGYSNKVMRRVDGQPPWHIDPGYYCGPPKLDKNEVRDLALSATAREFCEYAVSNIPKERMKYYDGHINCFTLGQLKKMGENNSFSELHALEYRKSCVRVFEKPNFDKARYKNMAIYVE